MLTADIRHDLADDLMHKIADYVTHHEIDSDEAYSTARACLADSLGCAILSLKFKECTKLLGPIVPGTIVPNGSTVPGTDYVLDPIRGAFNVGTIIRWLDYNDTWLAAEWGHPSDNLGGIYSVCDYLSRNGKDIKVKNLLTAMIKAHEIQGGLALENSFNRIGFDHVILVKVASAAVTAHLLGANINQVIDVVSNAWIDTGPLRTYRHAPNTGSRKSWAAGDATSRGLQLAMMVMQGEMGYPTALSAKRWGMYDVLFNGQPMKWQRPLGSYVMENVLFKISFPAEFHAQTAVECAIKLHEVVKNRINEIEKIEIDTHESAIRIIDKKGPLYNPADRDHCLQYMIAVGLLKGNLTADDYEDDAAQNPQIDQVREKMIVHENVQYSQDYLDPEKRSIANSLQVFFKDGSSSEKIVIEYPIGHRRRRSEGLPLLYEKCRNNFATHFKTEKVEQLVQLFQDPKKLDDMPMKTFSSLLTDSLNRYLKSIQI